MHILAHKTRREDCIQQREKHFPKTEQETSPADHAKGGFITVDNNKDIEQSLDCTNSQQQQLSDQTEKFLFLPEMRLFTGAPRSCAGAGLQEQIQDLLLLLLLILILLIFSICIKSSIAQVLLNRFE